MFYRWRQIAAGYLVHNVKQIHFSFKKHLASLDENQRAEFRSLCSYYARAYPSDDQAKVQAECLDNPKSNLAFGTLQLVLLLFLGAERRDVEQKLTAMRHQSSEAKAPLFDEIDLEASEIKTRLSPDDDTV